MTLVSIIKSKVKNVLILANFQQYSPQENICLEQIGRHFYNVAMSNKLKQATSLHAEPEDSLSWS
jgi:hypothetical protein